MRIAALYDIHGNVDALDAVLEDVRREQVDLIVIGGDVLPGPMPRETLRRLSDLGTPARFIRGNGDRVVVAQMTGGDVSEVPGAFREVIAWTAAQLDATDHEWLASWPSTCHVSVDGLGDVLFCHATARNDLECFTRLTPDEVVLGMFPNVTARTVICGHTHMQFDRTVGPLRVVNAGSVGMPFAAPRGAYWLLLGPGIELRRTTYDFDAAASRMQATSFPHVDTMFVRYVLDPPPEAESLAMFSGAPS